ncbi:hypothetical protein ACP70R_030880 [Stipagrostis hirtigluma subsp. patula]
MAATTAFSVSSSLPLVNGLLAGSTGEELLVYSPGTPPLGSELCLLLSHERATAKLRAIDAGRS